MIQWKYIQTLLCNNANSVHSVIINIGTNLASMIKKYNMKGVKKM